MNGRTLLPIPECSQSRIIIKKYFAPIACIILKMNGIGTLLADPGWTPTTEQAQIQTALNLPKAAEL